MKTLHLEIRVKFRIWGITLGKVEKTFDAPLPATVPVPEPAVILRFDERGVYVLARLDP